MRRVAAFLLALTACGDGRGSITVDEGDGEDVEGDAVGECTNRADDDRDGDFDCADANCAGSPDCDGGGGGTTNGGGHGGGNGGTNGGTNGGVDDTVTEVFPGAVSDEVDVLFVVDDSASMIEEQAALVAAFPTFLGGLVATDADFHVGVVTTDMDDPARSGALTAWRDHRWVEPTTPDQAVVFSHLAQPGTDGSADERGLLATMYAIARPVPALWDANDGFRRDDATLHVVVISDEDDHSSPVFTEPQLVDFLDQLEAASGLSTTLSALVGPAGGCEGVGGTAVAGTLYLHAAAATGGRTGSICAFGTWTGFFSTLASQLVASGRDAVTLAGPVDPATVAVTVTHGGATWTGVPSGSGGACGGGSGCFDFEVDGLQVRFVGAWRPPIGSTITVRYRP